MGITLLGVTQLRHQHLKNLNFFGFSILMKFWQNIHVQTEIFITILNNKQDYQLQIKFCGYTRKGTAMKGNAQN